MSIYPDTIRRCQHIKINGTQCGSPALRDKKYCYFHNQWRETRIPLNSKAHVRGIIDFPVLEDANSIQISLMQVLRLIASGQLDAKTAGLLLYGLQTASNNLSRIVFEPYPRTVVIHPEWVEDTCLGDNAWEKEDFEESDEDENEEEANEQDEGDEAIEEEEEEEEEDSDGEESAVGEELGPDPAERIDNDHLTEEQIREIFRRADELESRALDR